MRKWQNPGRPNPVWAQALNFKQLHYINTCVCFYLFQLVFQGLGGRSPSRNTIATSDINVVRRARSSRVHLHLLTLRRSTCHESLQVQAPLAALASSQGNLGAGSGLPLWLRWEMGVWIQATEIGMPNIFLKCCVNLNKEPNCSILHFWNLGVDAYLPISVRIKWDMIHI